MAFIFNYEELNNISKDFYDLFEGKNNIETNESYNLKKQLAKYVEHAKFSHDVAHNDCKLTFEEWALKYKVISKKL